MIAEIDSLPIDKMHKSLAGECIAELVKRCQRQGPPTLKTIALGALTWSDVWLGSHDSRREKPRDNLQLRWSDICLITKDERCRREELRDFLQLRVYQIDYQHDAQGACSPVLSMVAKGSPRDLQASCNSLSILEPDWSG